MLSPCPCPAVPDQSFRIWNSLEVEGRAMTGLSRKKSGKRDGKCPPALNGIQGGDLEETGPCDGVAESSERHRVSNGEPGSTRQTNELHQLITAK